MHTILISCPPLHFQSSTQDDDDKMSFKCPLLSNTDRTENDVHFQLDPSLPCPFFPHCCYTPPSPRVRVSFMGAPLKTDTNILISCPPLHFQSSTQNDDDKMSFKCPLLSSRDHIEKDVHLQLSPLRLSTVDRIVANPIPPQRSVQSSRMPL